MAIIMYAPDKKFWWIVNVIGVGLGTAIVK